jgi:hypothetical protein
MAMVARAHAVHDYSFAGAPVRPRRQVWLQDDEPVVLPRGRSESRAGAALVISAILASVLVAGSTYAVYRTAPPELAETPTAPFTMAWEPDAAVTQASTLNALLGPAMAVPGVEGPTTLSEPASTSDVPAQTGSSREVIIDDSAPGVQQALPQPAPELGTVNAEPPSSLPAAPYPNPTITPPEMVAPPSSTPEAPPVNLDAENPY